MRINYNTSLSFEDVLLVPQECVVQFRADVNLTTTIFSGNRYKDSNFERYLVKLRVPILSAAMSSVTEYKMAEAMKKSNAGSVIHRFMTKEDQYSNFKSADDQTGICAIGINERYERYEYLFNRGVKNFCLDIAHAHSVYVETFIRSLPNREQINLMVGNVATANGAYFLADLGVDSVKVGIGSGAACSTRETTGHGVPQLQAIIDCALVLEEFPDVSLVADGGIRNASDIIKSLAAGANAVMLGRLLAGADESPSPGEYWGMASSRENNHRAPEGVEGSVERTGPVADTIKKLAWGIRSGVSYAGASNLKELRENAEFRVVSPASLSETYTRI